MSSTNNNTIGTATTTRFKGKQDRYNGVIVDSTFEPCNINEFCNKLTESLNEWTINKKRGIWFKVDIDHADWVPVLTKNGFKFHHAKENFVMLYKWLPLDEVCNVPQYAHTMLGVGALIVNDQDEVLVVKEKYFIGKRHWKLPGGYVEPGEELIAACVREVYEETNIKCEFKSLISLRHTHNVMFGCSDIYTVMLLHATTTDVIQCERELTACKWMPINDYLASMEVSELNKLFVHKYLHYKQRNINIDVQHAIHPILNKPYTMFSVTQTPTPTPTETHNHDHGHQQNVTS